MVKWFQRISFRGKLLTMNFLLLFTAVVISLVFYINGVSSAMKFNVSHVTQFNEQMNLMLDMALETKTVPNLIHFVDNDVKLLLRQENAGKSATRIYEDERKMTSYLKMITLIRTNTLRSTIVTKNGDIYSSYDGDMEDYENYMGGLCEKLTWDKRVEPYYTEVHSEMLNSTSKLVLTAVYQMYEIGASEGFGYLFLDMDYSEITKMLNAQSNAPESFTSSAIFAGQDVIYNSKEAFMNLSADLDKGEQKKLAARLKADEEAGIQNDTITIDGTPCIVSVVKNESTGWYILQYMPKDALLLYSMKSMIAIAAVLVVLLIAALILSILLANYVSHPVQSLSEVMSKAKVGEVQPYEGNTAVWQDEIGQLIQSYNDMGARINDSINRIYIYQLNQKQTELKMLQFQINPHFLYNALHTISSIAKLEDVEYISDIAEGLSDMFRYNIKGGEFARLEDEITQVHNYIQIQSIRFPGRYDVQYEIEESVKNAVVLKFILQPIVENSMHHAFAGKRGGNRLRIRAKTAGEKDLVIEVEDNGVGMTREQVEKQNEKLGNTRANTLLHDKGDSIGLTNVNARLKNYYGEEYGVWVSGEEGKFTCITLRLQARWEMPVQEVCDESNRS